MRSGQLCGILVFLVFTTGILPNCYLATRNCYLATKSAYANAQVNNSPTVTSPPNSDELYNLAIRAYRAQDFKKAVEYLEEYIKRRPAPEAYYLLGYSYYKLKLFDRAEEAFNEVYLIDPDFVPLNLMSK